jgi:hypothetical protein
MASIEWCERYTNQQLEDNRWFNEPINTFSNIVYLVSVYNTRQMGHNLLSIYSSLLMCITGIGSICFHGSGTRIGQLLDEIPIVLLCDSYIKMLDIDIRFSRNKIYEYSVSVLTLLYILTGNYTVFLTVITGQGLAISGLIVNNNINYGINISHNKAIFVFILGKVLWEYERFLYRINACPQEGTLVYLHGGWHVATAVMHYYIVKGSTTY